jgi:single-stranded DNA-binding protein
MLHSTTRIAHNERRKTDGVWIDNPQYFNVVIWTSLAQWTARNIRKGDKVIINGKHVGDDARGWPRTKRVHVYDRPRRATTTTSTAVPSGAAKACPHAAPRSRHSQSSPTPKE